MPITYEPITTQILASPQADITFSSIPATYTDLVLVCAVKTGNNANPALPLTFNGSTSNYSSMSMYGNGSSVGSARTTSSTPYIVIARQIGLGSINEINTLILNFNSYANTSVNKTVIARVVHGGGTETDAGLWQSTDAINQINIL